MSAREKAESRLLRRLSYKLSVQLPDKTVVFISVHRHTLHHEAVAGVLQFTNAGGRNGKYCATAWALWLSEPDKPSQALADDAVMIDVLVSCARWRDGGDGLLFLLRRRTIYPDAARATTPGLPSTALAPTVPVR